MNGTNVKKKKKDKDLVCVPQTFCPQDMPFAVSKAVPELKLC